jgi:3-oxoacyl-[acyl-carrier protein] reductase
MTKTAIVTGAAKGIGKAITEKCLKEGWAVVACDKDEAALKELKQEHDVKTFRLDVTDPRAIQTFFKSLEKADFPYALVNNAGIFRGTKFLEYTSEAVDLMFDVNLKGPIYCSQAFGALLIEQGKQGVIVNIASVAGQAGSADAIYGASKAGLIGFTKTCAMAFSPHIRVNAVAPGMVETDMWAQVSDERRLVFKNSELVKETIMPQDVAESVWFLLSDASKHYTGAVLDINNGFYFR